MDKKLLKNFEKNENLFLNFIDIRDLSPLQITIYTPEIGRCFIKTNFIELAGKLKSKTGGLKLLNIKVFYVIMLLKFMNNYHFNVMIRFKACQKNSL